DSPIVNIHPEGDVVLTCGSITPKRLRVSSLVLSMASPVFKVLFEPKFEEGIALASDKSLDITLPEDDPDAMESICNVLHLRNDEAGISTTDHRAMTARQVLEIAVFCDKYNCQTAMAAAATCWLLSCESSRSEDLHMLITAAYRFQ
ncbi:hypothetical protein DOTSEDRAFT_108293, partial [Dothistroma septosporum NZE10]